MQADNRLTVTIVTRHSTYSLKRSGRTPIAPQSSIPQARAPVTVQLQAGDARHFGNLRPRLDLQEKERSRSRPARGRDRRRLRLRRATTCPTPPVICPARRAKSGTGHMSGAAIDIERAYTCIDGAPAYAPSALAVPAERLKTRQAKQLKR